MVLWGTTIWDNSYDMIYGSVQSTWMASFSDIELSPPNTGPAPLRLFKQLQLLKKVEKYSFFRRVRKVSFYHKSSTYNKLLSSPEDPTLLKPYEFVPGHIKRCHIFIFFVCKCAEILFSPPVISSPQVPLLQSFFFQVKSCGSSEPVASVVSWDDPKSRDPSSLPEGPSPAS